MPAAAAAASNTTPTILIVEDDASVRQMLHHMLTQLGSATVAAVDAAGAVAMALTQSMLSLALIDLRLHGSDGVTAACALQALRPDLLIVLMSADRDHLRVAQQHVGTLHVLHKPLSLHDLAELVAMAQCHPRQSKE